MVVTVTVMVPVSRGWRAGVREDESPRRAHQPIQAHYLFVPYLALHIRIQLLSYPHIIRLASLRINIMVKSTIHPVCDIASKSSQNT
jgi:hypothetical protein